ncbi:MAG: peptidylprolyl isomerase [Planctomycetes bacterium]|nr:peptidylprolyl isomerase [Planctomycetota bacterium]
MSANPTPTVSGTTAPQGTQAPSQIELFWERWRSLFTVILLVVVGALGAKYAWQYYEGKKVDAALTEVYTSLGIEATYTDQSKSWYSATDCLATVDSAKLKAAVGTAPASVKPYLMLAIARKAVQDKDWAAAEATLADLEKAYPNHILVKSSSHPVQARDEIKDKSKDKPKPNDQKKPEFKPAVAGSQVQRMREEIAAAKAFQAPAHFAKVAVPADATKLKWELSNNTSFVMALMPEAAKHREAILKLVASQEGSFWKGIAIDQIRRPTKNSKRPHELHLGFESTKDDDRTKWSDTEPSKNQLDIEKNTLSHFAGAVSARAEADGKSCADRFWINLDDAPANDGERVIVGFVVEGIDNLKKVCESTMTATEEEQGQGRPSENIRVTSVTVVK